MKKKLKLNHVTNFSIGNEFNVTIEMWILRYHLKIVCGFFLLFLKRFNQKRNKNIELIHVINLNLIYIITMI